MTIQITIEAHCLDEEFEATCKEAGIAVIDRTQEPWSVVFEGERDALIKLVAMHWLGDDGATSIDEAESIVNNCTLKAPHQPLHEYAFDVTLKSVVRVRATTEAQARDAMEATIDAMAPTQDWIGGFNYANTWCKVTEVSLAPLERDDDPYHLFEIDGVSNEH